MKRSYFVCSVGKAGEKYAKENLTRCLLNNCFVLHNTNEQKGEIREIKKGDILILKFEEHFIGYGRAVSELKTDLDLGDGWSWTIDVNLWITGNHAHRYGIKNATEEGSPYATVKKVSRDFALGKMEEIGFPF